MKGINLSLTAHKTEETEDDVSVQSMVLAMSDSSAFGEVSQMDQQLKLVKERARLKEKMEEAECHQVENEGLRKELEKLRKHETNALQSMNKSSDPDGQLSSGAPSTPPATAAPAGGLREP